jgi:hypothetical protein
MNSGLSTADCELQDIVKPEANSASWTPTRATILRQLCKLSPSILEELYNVAIALHGLGLG